MKSPDDLSRKTTDQTTASSSLSREEEAEVFEKWKYLIIHILQHNFAWAWSGQTDKRGRKLRRPLDYGDLFQEASMGLLEASRKYNRRHPSKASFKTYAFRAISSRIADFISKNQTPVSVSYTWRLNRPTTPDRTKEQIRRALRCDFFSETYPPRTVEKHQSEPHEKYKEWETAIIDRSGGAGYDGVDTDDYVQAAADKLIEELTREEYKLLSFKIGGLSNREIAKQQNCSEETVRLKVQAVFDKARRVLSEPS